MSPTPNPLPALPVGAGAVLHPADSPQFAAPDLRAAHRMGLECVQLLSAPGGQAFAVVHKDQRIENIDKYLPAVRAAKHTLLSEQSLLDYIAAFETPDTRLFATVGEAPTLRAEFDYLPGSKAAAPLAGGERRHVVTWRPKLSPEWTAWTKIERVQLSQAEAAEFLDEWGYCCATPDAMTMIELAQSLQATATNSIKNAQRLKDGAGHMEHRVTIETSAGVDGKLSIPDGGVLRLPMFEGGPEEELRFKLRIRIVGGALKLIVLYHRLPDVRREAFGRAMRRVEEGTGLTVYVEG